MISPSLRKPISASRARYECVDCKRIMIRMPIEMLDTRHYCTGCGCTMFTLKGFYEGFEDGLTETERKSERYKKSMDQKVRVVPMRGKR